MCGRTQALVRGRRHVGRHHAFVLSSEFFPHGSPLIGLYVFFFHSRPARISGYPVPRAAMNANMVSTGVGMEPGRVLHSHGLRRKARPSAYVS